MTSSKPTNDYYYDVFVSYARHNRVGTWVQDCFLELLEEYLKPALGYSPQIFIDTRSIPAGSAWPLEIQTALSHSKCLVAILSIDYFYSNWCMKECHTMLARERVEGFRTPANTDGLVLPIVTRDDRYHPNYIKNIQSADFSKYVRREEAFVKSARYMEFEDEMEQWTKQVADAVRKAPLWKDSWPSEKDIEIPEFKVLEFNSKPQIG